MSIIMVAIRCNFSVRCGSQSALQAFLDDQRKFAATDEEWVTETASCSKEQMDAMPGCDCDECQLLANC